MHNRSSEKSTYELVNNWLTEYASAEKHSEKRARIKALIVAQMLPIVKKIAHTIARRSYDPIEDMVQAGCIGLLKAIDSFSFTINNNFKVYAGSLIIGEMKHYLRDKLHTIRVPRHIQELSFRINSFIANLTPEELNELTNDNVAEALHVPKKDVDFVMEVERRKYTLSLDAIYTNDDDNLGYEEILSKNLYKDEYNEIEDVRLMLADIIEKLPDEYKTIVNLYYYKDMMQKEIAQELCLTEMQVSRKMKKAFSMLYKMISDSENRNKLLGET